MAQWKIKEFALLTSVTVRTLHHYDQQGLLKPSFRQDNGYRMYTDKDLINLQQILALKFFGFSLQQIKKLMKNQNSLMASLHLQIKLLQEKIGMLTQAHASLQAIIANEMHDEQRAWHQILESVKVYTIIEQFEKNWPQEILNQQELQEYIEFEKSWQERFSLKDQKRHEQQWQAIVQNIAKHLKDSPAGAIGQQVAHDCLQFLDEVYGKKYAHLSRTIWEKGFQTNKIAKIYDMTPEMVAWLDLAITHYYKNKK